MSFRLVLGAASVAALLAVGAPHEKLPTSCALPPGTYTYAEMVRAACLEPWPPRDLALPLCEDEPVRSPHDSVFPGPCVADQRQALFGIPAVPWRSPLEATRARSASTQIR